MKASNVATNRRLAQNQMLQKGAFRSPIFPLTALSRRSSSTNSGAFSAAMSPCTPVFRRLRVVSRARSSRNIACHPVAAQIQRRELRRVQIRDVARHTGFLQVQFDQPGALRSAILPLTPCHPASGR